MINQKKIYSTFCFDRIILKKDKLIKNKEGLNELAAQYVYHLRRCGLNDDKIYEMLLIHQFIKNDKSRSRKEIVEHLLQDCEEVECYEFYGQFDRTNLFCRACGNCVIDNNQFREIEYKLLLLCLYNEKMVEMVSAFEKDGPIFNCVETDEFYNENKLKGVSPSFVFPFTRLFFDEILINKMSEEKFLNSLGSKYGDEKMVFECARKLINQLMFEKSTLRRTPVNKTMAKKYATKIHNVFGRSRAFPPIGLTSKTKGNENVKQVNILEEIGSSVKNEIKDKSKKPEVTNKDEVNKQAVIKKSDNSSKEVREKTKDLKTNDIKNEPVLVKKDDKQKTDLVIKNLNKKQELPEYPSCKFVVKIDIAKLEDVYNIEDNGEVFLTFENGILEDGYISCRLVENNGMLYILCYVKCLSKYFYCNLDYEKGINMLSFYMEKKAFKIYTDMPWLLIGEFYGRKNIICSKVKSFYQMYLFLYKKDKYSFANMIYDILGCVPSKEDNVFLYTISKFQPACDLLENEIRMKNKMCELEDIGNVDILYGISMANLNDEELFCIDNNGFIKYGHNTVNDNGENVYFKFTIDMKKKFEKTTNAYIRDEIISRYIREGKLKKCIPIITNINQDSYLFKVKTEEEYEFIFNLFIFYSRCIVNESHVSFKAIVSKI